MNDVMRVLRFLDPFHVPNLHNSSALSSPRFMTPFTDHHLPEITFNRNRVIQFKGKTAECLNAVFFTVNYGTDNTAELSTA